MQPDSDRDWSLEPETWLLAFHTRTTSRLVGWLAWGRFKHVLAFGYIRRIRAWVFFEPALGRTRLFVAPDGPVADSMIAEAISGASVLSIRPAAATRASWPVFGWCVPAVAHLIGLRSGALRPDALWRDCLRAGAQSVLQESRCEDQGTRRN